MAKWIKYLVCLISLINFQNTSGNTFSTKLNYKVNQFDPIKIDDGWSIQVAFQVYRKLFKINNSGEVVPDLATSYSRKENLHEICIRNDAYFSEGSKITIDDVIYSIERAANPHKNQLTSFYFSRIKGYKNCKTNELLCSELEIKKINNSCLRIVTDYGAGSFFKILTSVSGSVLKKGSMPTTENLRLISFSGEYYIKKIDSKSIFLEKNLYSNKKTKFNSVNFYFDEQGSTLDTLKKDNFVKYNFDVSNSEIDKKEIFAKSVSTNYFFLVSKKRNIKERTTISNALRCLADKEMIRDLYGHSMQVTHSFFPSKLFFTVDKNLIDDSNCESRKSEVFETVYIAKEMVNSEKLAKKLNELSIVKNLGLKFSLVDFNTMYGEYLSGNNKKTILMGMIPGYLDIEYYLLEWFHESSPVKLISNSQSEVDEFLELTDRKKKLHVLKKIITNLKSQKIILPFLEEVVLFSKKDIDQMNIFSHWGEYSMNISEY